MYLYDTWRGERTRNWWILTSINVLLVLIGSFTMVAGMLTHRLQNSFLRVRNVRISRTDQQRHQCWLKNKVCEIFAFSWEETDHHSPFSCADNSNSV